MPDITVTLTQTQYNAMTTDMVNVSEWINNFSVERGNTEIRKIINLLVAHCNENDVQLAVGQDAQVQQAFDLGIVAAATATDGGDD